MLIHIAQTGYYLVDDIVHLFEAGDTITIERYIMPALENDIIVYQWQVFLDAQVYHCKVCGRTQTECDFESEF